MDDRIGLSLEWLPPAHAHAHALGLKPLRPPMPPGGGKGDATTSSFDEVKEILNILINDVCSLEEEQIKVGS